MMPFPSFAHARNGQSLALDEIAPCGFDGFRHAVIDAVDSGWRIASLFGVLQPGGKEVELWAVLAEDDEGRLHILKTVLDSDAYPALTPECPQAHCFEREIAGQWGLRADDHPWFKPLRFHRSYRSGRDAWKRADAEEVTAGVTNFYRVEGDEIHEVAVGPVHAGVIEPGHFRFQCHGERVLHLEISLGYQHRGVERALVGGPTQRSLHYMETLAGDTSIGHATAYCQALESLANCRVPARGQILRGISLELERLANHVGDLGALAGDVGYLPTAAFCGRLRGDFLNATAVLCGSRFGRGMIRPGGVGFDIDAARVEQLQTQLRDALRDVTQAANLLWETPSVQARFENVGRLARDACEQLGLVGPAARACGVPRDVRQQFPTGIYQFAQINVSTAESGDVFARAYVRWLEIQRSTAFIQEQLEALPSGPVRVPLGPLACNQMVVTLVEGWRGEICHTLLTDGQGKFAHYKVVDPSFHNWIGLALALRGEQISDFPLCNKSFNLSYCGHDL